MGAGGGGGGGIGGAGGGGGSGPCIHCADAIAGGDPTTLCARSAPLYNTLFLCVCGDPVTPGACNN
jgi:hypothetical protein